MYSKDELKEQLTKFNIAKGKPVTIHLSMKAVGQIEGGAEGLLSVLIDYFADEDGLLIVPSHTWRFACLNLKKAETCVGVLPNIAVLRSDGVRSLHPTHSVVVFGERERAEEFVRDDAFTDTLTSPKGSYGKLYDEDGYVLLIGVGHDKNTYLHCVEEMIGKPNRKAETLTETTIIHKDGKEEKRLIYWINKPEVSSQFGKFEPVFRYYDCIIDGHIGSAAVQLCSAKKMKDAVELVYKNNEWQELLDNDCPIDEKLYKKINGTTF